MEKLLILLLFIVSLFNISTCRIFTRCELAEILVKVIPKDDVADWVCFAEGGRKDGLNTHKFSNMNPASHNIAHGIFQISSIYFCDDHRHHINVCGIECKKLLDDDILDDVACAQRVMKDTGNGLTSFHSWVNNCQNKNVSVYTAGCNLPL